MEANKECRACTGTALDADGQGCMFCVRGVDRDYRSPDLFGDSTLLDPDTIADITVAPRAVLERIAAWEPQTRSLADLEFISRAIIELARRNVRQTQPTQPRMQAVQAEIRP